MSLNDTNEIGCTASLVCINGQVAIFLDICCNVATSQSPLANTTRRRLAKASALHNRDDLRRRRHTAFLRCCFVCLDSTRHAAAPSSDCRFAPGGLAGDPRNRSDIQGATFHSGVTDRHSLRSLARPKGRFERYFSAVRGFSTSERVLSIGVEISLGRAGLLALLRGQGGKGSFPKGRE